MAFGDRRAPLKRTPFKKKRGYFSSFTSTTTRPIKVKKAKPKSSIRKLWDAFSQYVRQFYADESGMVSCISCPTRKHWKEMQAGHFVHAAKTNHVSYDTRNVKPQCAQCNKWRNGNPLPYAQVLQAVYGFGIIEELRRIKAESRGLTRGEIEILMEKFS